MPTTEPNEDQLAAFRAADQDEPITMVNLLKFRAWADYEDRRGEGVMETKLSGREAYQLYADVASAKIRENGGNLTFVAPSQQLFVGDAPTDDWDMVALVHYPSRAAYLKGFDSPEYQDAIQHRVAGLEKRLLLQCTVSVV